MNEEELYKLKIQSLGPFEALDFFFHPDVVEKLMEPLKDQWFPYNPEKVGFNRFGLSLTSLDGEVGGVDLTSLAEHNERTGTDYGEMSFRAPTRHWKELSYITDPLEPIKQFVGRSHIIRLDRGGFFPPHRDFDSCFRLIACLNCNSEDAPLVMDDRLLPVTMGRLYFLDTTRNHSIFSYHDNRQILVFNIRSTAQTYRFVQNHLQQK